MDELWKNIPEIITKAAESHLGILALMIIGLAILAFFFFRGADVKVQVVIFVMLFFGVVAFGVAVLKVPPRGLTLVASIWKVESGRQSTELATKEFSSGAGHGGPAGAGHGVSAITLKEFAEWVSNQLKLTARAVPVRIGVKTFEGPEKITERVRNELKKNPLIQIVDPGSPGIDYIISGSAKPTMLVRPR
jgi:hypothetical protein